MSNSSRSISILFRTLLLLSGWGVAIWLAMREEPVPPPVHVRKEPLARIFNEWIADPALSGAAVGICLLDEKGNVAFSSPLGETALCPASSLKTVTSGAALGILGPDFRFVTTLEGSAATQDDGALPGDLVLVGGGDPTFSIEDLDEIAKAVSKSGLKRVTGNVRVDASIFPAEVVSDFWNWGDIGNAYGAGAFGLNLEHNRMTVTFDPGAQVGAPAKFVGGSPALQETQWENHVTTGPAGSGDNVVVYSHPGARRIILRGTVPLGQPGFKVGGAIPDPPALAAELLRARLESAGVVVEGKTDLPAGGRNVVARHESAPLPEIIDHLHRVSDNLETQCLFLTIGLRQKSKPADAVKTFWEKAGVSFVGLRLLDGNGLARANVIRPRDLAAVNYAARHGPHGDRFKQSLTKYLDSHVSAKLGWMSGVSTEVGFLTAKSGREYTFAIMGNALPAGVNFGAARNRLLETLRTEL